MLEGWTDRVPALHGVLTTLREVAASDVYSLFTLFSNPAVTAYMAPPPPTLAKFAGFVEWSHQQRAQGHGVCFGIVPVGMTAAVGILQVRLEPTSSDAEWGFVLEYLISGPRACFRTPPTCWRSLPLRPCTSTVSTRASPCGIDAHTPPCKDSGRGSRRRSRGRDYGAFPAILSRCGRCGKTTGGTGRAILVCRPTTRRNGSGRRSRQQRASCGEATRLRPSNRIRCSCLTAADKNDATPADRAHCLTTRAGRRLICQNRSFYNPEHLPWF